MESKADASGQSEVEIVWYGERGVVNSLVTALRAAGVDAVKELLSVIQWANGSNPSWIEHVSRVSLIIEVGLSHFGDPDLILVCQTSDERPFVVFVEAKVIPYADSAMAISDGMRKNFNSSVNGQLTLKYRCARALEKWTGAARPLTEQQDIFGHYKRLPSQGGLKDTRQRVRRLQKPSVLRILDEHGLAQLPINRTHFVALTTDEVSPFITSEFLSSDYRPLFLDSDGKEVLSDFSGRLGWLGFGKIAMHSQLNLHLGPDFHGALEAMEQCRPIGLEGREQSDEFPNVRPYETALKSSSSVQATLKDIQVMAVDLFGAESVEVRKGSISIKPLGKVMVKVIPREPGPNEYILFGVSSSLGRRDWGVCQMDHGITLVGQRFFVTRLDPSEAALETVDGVFNVLSEMIIQ